MASCRNCHALCKHTGASASALPRTASCHLLLTPKDRELGPCCTAATAGSCLCRRLRRLTNTNAPADAAASTTNPTATGTAMATADTPPPPPPLSPPPPSAVSGGAAAAAPPAGHCGSSSVGWSLMQLTSSSVQTEKGRPGGTGPHSRGLPGRSIRRVRLVRPAHSGGMVPDRSLRSSQLPEGMGGKQGWQQQGEKQLGERRAGSTGAGQGWLGGGECHRHPQAHSLACASQQPRQVVAAAATYNASN